MKAKILISIFSIVALLSCNSGKNSDITAGGDTLHFDYSRLLTVVDYGKYRTVDIADPWKEGRTLHRYVLVNDPSAPHLPKGTVIKVPVKNAMVFTTVHAALLADLQSSGVIKGMADVRYVKRKDIKALVDSHRILDVGNSMAPDIEKIIDAGADCVFVSPFENSGGYGKLEEIDIPIIECADYMEVSPLARAEWMKFYGMLCGNESVADSLFSVVEKNYRTLASSVAHNTNKPSVVVDIPSSSVWYVPGGKSTIGQMVADAGGSYCFADDSSSGSTALSVETVLDKCTDADIWLFRYGGEKKTISMMKEDNKAFENIKAFKNGNVWGCSTERTTFYETTPFRPDNLLQEFIAIFHPECPCEMKYFEKIYN